MLRVTTFAIEVFTVVRKASRIGIKMTVDIALVNTFASMVETFM